MDYRSIVGGKTSDGTPYLELFLQDYSKSFGAKNLSAGCGNCVQEYLKKYKQKHTVMSNKCDYVLHKKREGLSLGFNSGVIVTNANLTNEYAERLIKNYRTNNPEFDISLLFEKYPKPKPKRKRRSKSQDNKND